MTVASRLPPLLTRLSFWPRRFTVCAVAQVSVVNVNDSDAVNVSALSGPSSSTGPVADTITVTVAVGRLASFTVYDAAPAFSETERVVCDNTNPAPSSSVNINIAEVAVTAGVPDTVPDTVTVSSSSSTLFGVGVNVKLPLADPVSAGMVMSKPVTGAKPTLPATPEPATDTATVRASSKRTLPPIVAVTSTLVAPALSATEVGDTLNAMPGVASLSVIAMLVPVTVKPASVPSIDNDCTGSSKSSSVGVNMKVVPPDAASAAMVIS